MFKSADTMVDSGQNLCAGIWQDTLSVKNDFETLIIFEGIFLRYKIQMHYLKKKKDWTSLQPWLKFYFYERNLLLYIP